MTDLYATGSWSCAYEVAPVEDPPGFSDFRRILQQIKGHETGWPVWLSLDSRPEMQPQVVGDVIECWLKSTPDQDFWRADPRGRMFLIRRLQEDTREIQGVEPGKVFDLTLPVWRTGECLLHASRLATRLGADHVDLKMQWRGLVGRQLATVASPMRGMIDPSRVASDDTVQTSVSTSPGAIADALPELVEQLTEPLFARFGFFEPPGELYATEIERMRRGV